MPLRKKKVVEDDFDKPRRSSLQVNLSFLSNATDSNHESFEKSREEKTTQNPPKQSETSPKNERNLPKILSIQKNFNYREESTRKNFSHLRDEILRKTEEMFEQGSELAVKTRQVLQEDPEIGKSVDLSNCVKSPSVRLNLREDEQIIMSGKKNTEPVSVNVMKCLSDPETPRNSRFSITPNDRQSFPRKRLFSDENNPENIPESKSRQTGIFETPNRLGSPILSGNSKKRLKLLLRKEKKDSTPKVKNKSDFSGLPFIDRRDKSSESSCMEITTIASLLPITVRNSRKVEDSFKGSQDKRIVSMDLTEVKGNILQTSPLREDDNFPDDLSVRTTRTSLNVNTSMDPIQERENSEIPQRNRLSLKIRDNFPNKGQNSEDFPNEAENLENFPNEGQSSKFFSNEARNSEDFLPSKSNLTVNQGKKVLELNSVSMGSSNLEKSVHFVENTSLREGFSFPRKGKRNSRSLNSTSGIGETSRVEGTPFPVSRSILWKSQIKQNTFASNWNYDSSESSQQSIADGVKRKRSKESKGTRHPALESPGTEKSSKAMNDSRTSSKTEDSSRNSKKQRKKLFPLRGHSQHLSLSPTRSVSPSPKPKVFPPRRKNKKWIKVQEKKQKEMSLRTQKTQQTQTQKTQRDSESSMSDDEFEFESKSVPVKRKKPRRVLRKKIVIKPVPSSSSQRKLRDRKLTQSIETIDEDFSDDQNDFEPIIAKRKKKVAKRFFIVSTGFTNGDKSLLKTVVKELGKAELESNVTHKTTHVVSTGLRTTNLLKGILRGCWLVGMDWVLQSLENRDWLNPESFEMAPFAEAVKENRRDRQLFGNNFVPELFSTCGLIYVNNGTNPAPPVLKDLIKSAGGQITENPAVSNIIIGSNGLKEIWILDSITSGELQPKKQYRKK